jgi:two-component system phosphate regulon sensor histidine kinase PhoR
MSALGAIAVIALAALTANATIAAGVAVFFFMAIGAYLVTPKPPDARNFPSTQESSAPPIMTDAARSLLEALDDPITVFDATGRVLFANRASQALVGSDSERKHVTAVLRYPEIIGGVERVQAGGEAESIVFTILVPVERHYMAHIAPVKLGGGRSNMIILQFHDLTSMRRAEEMRADFVANASHELRTPLAAVSGFIDTLRGHAKNDTEARERFLEIMSVETARMRRLIDDLLSLTRIELNEHNPPMGTVDLVSVVRDAATVLAPLAELDGVTLEIESGDPLWATGDRDELIQVFQNLVHNAIKYGRENGTVRIRFGRSLGTGRNPAQVFVSIQDEGEGIPREAIPRLTERFYRVDVKRSRERGGTGLGLAIVKHILNRHNGKLQIDSVLGQGSTFTVSLPGSMAAPEVQEIRPRAAVRTAY